MILNTKEKREYNKIIKIINNTNLDINKLNIDLNINQINIFKIIIRNLFELRLSYPHVKKSKIQLFLKNFNKLWTFLKKPDIKNRNNSFLYDILNFKNISYELFTIEFIKLILKQLNNSKIIVEMGAGNGTLSYLLRYYDKKNKKIIATDIQHSSNESWKIKTDYSIHIIKNIDEIIKKYNPDTIIISWMPLGLNLLKDIKKFKTIKTIILIGNIDATGTKQMYNDKKLKEIKNNLQICISDDHLITGYPNDKSVSKLFIYKS